jgi:hypothetical protein
MAKRLPKGVKKDEPYYIDGILHRNGQVVGSPRVLVRGRYPKGDDEPRYQPPRKHTSRKRQQFVNHIARLIAGAPSLEPLPLKVWHDGEQEIIVEFTDHYRYRLKVYTSYQDLPGAIALDYTGEE